MPKLQLKGVEKLAKQLKVKFPEDYKSFICENPQAEVYHHIRYDNWHFLPLTKVKSHTLELRNKDIIAVNEVVFAQRNSEQFLLYKPESFYKHPDNEQLSSRIYFVDTSDNCLFFYAFDILEILNSEATSNLIKKIKPKNIPTQNLKIIQNSVGSMFYYANALWHKDFAEEYYDTRNKKVLKFFYELAEKGHPEASSKIAMYLNGQEITNVKEVIKWRRKAIEQGSLDDMYYLADFIIDHKLSLINEAIELLEYVINRKIKVQQALLKLAKVYMKGLGVEKNPGKAFKYLMQCIDLYPDNSSAFAELSFYYYKKLS